MIEGGCFCGSVRYRAGGKPSHETLCHCTICRRTCGTPLSYQSDALSAEIDLTICSLDAPERFAPRDHTFTRSRLAWLSLRDALPAFPGTRD